MIDKAEVL